MKKQSTKVFHLVFLKKEQVAEGVFCYFFDRKGFDFLAGQYVQMILPHDSDDRGTSRFFTLSSSPTEDELFITTKEGKSSFKKTLFDLKPGDKVQVFGPMGTFVLVED